MTNYENIKNMSVDEMAKIINPYITCVGCEKQGLNCWWDCELTIKKWLESEVSNDD